MGAIGPMLGARSTLPARADVERGVVLLMAEVRRAPSGTRIARAEWLAERAGKKGIPVPVSEGGEVRHTAALTPLMMADLCRTLEWLVRHGRLTPTLEDVRSALCAAHWGARP